MKKKKHKTTGGRKRSQKDPPQDADKVRGRQRTGAKAKAKKRDATAKQLRRIRQASAQEQAAKECCPEWQQAIDLVDWANIELPRHW